MTAVIETERLILRPPTIADFDAFAAMLADPVGMEHLGGPQPRAQAWRVLMTYAGAWALTGATMFLAVEKATGEPVGRIGPWFPEGWPGPEVGWSLVPDRWGRGLATEGAAAAIDYAFDVLGWTEVVHTIQPANAPSIRVAERLGSTFREEAMLPAPYNRPTGVWGQARATWKVRRRS
ncbi:MAG: GNAT family N-acetyltransferase [Caulobacteraceae bacterium]|nr:GNAT family N-acetyltransferase [Caulobacter sp.]